MPTTKRGVRDWLKRNDIPLTEEGNRFTFSLLDLPEPVQLAYRLRQAEEAGLTFGEQDDAAHVELQGKPTGVQKVAHARAAMLALVHKHRQAGLQWPQIVPLFKGAGFVEVPSERTVKRWFQQVEGVDPANWAPALAPDYKGRSVKAAMTDAAWQEFCAKVSASGRNGTGVNFKRLWEQVKKTAAKSGWDWPTYPTVLREFQRLPVEHQRALTNGAEEAAKSITIRLERSVDGLFAMEQVELDGREFKVKVRFENGTVGCPWIIVYADRASSKIVGWAISESENAEAAAEATHMMCDTYGIADRVITDNSNSFNGHRMAGGLSPLIRRKETKKASWEVPGVFKIYGMELKNCAPRKGWAKLVESVYSVLRHVDNDPVFNGAQRSGPTDAPNLDPKPVDIALFRAFIEQEIARFNANRDTRALGIKKGENRDEAFERLSKGRIARPVTPLIYRQVRAYHKLALVTQTGQIKFDGGTWGDETTQTGMLRHAGTKVLVGFDPQNHSAPAMVFGWEDPKWKGRLLFDALPNVEKARHNDETSRRRAITEERRAKTKTAQYIRADLPDLVEGWRAEVMANAGPAPVPTAPKVVQLDTRGPFSPASAHYKTNELSQAAAILALLNAEEDQRNRAASGGNR